MGAGTGLGVAEEWLRAAEALRERGRLSWAVAAAVEAACGAEGQQVALRALEAIVARAVAEDGVPATAPVRSAPPVRQAKAGPGRPAPAEDGPTTWRQMQQSGLSETVLPAVWFASGGIGEVRATVALGLRADGGKRVLGVWGGGAGETRCSQAVAADLRGRGLGRGTAWLAVTEGERALDVALSQQWGPRVLVAHCVERVGVAVTAHLPVGLRSAAAAALHSAWERVEAEEARRALSTLAESWQREHPGAARRLAVEIEATTSVTALGLRGALAWRLQRATPARYLLAQCLPAARGLSGREATAAVAAAARGREHGFRRVSERAGLADLARLLTKQTELRVRQDGA